MCAARSRRWPRSMSWSCDPIAGAYVATPSPQEAHEIFEARRTIERTLGRHVIERATKADIAEMREIIAQEAQARAEGDKPPSCASPVRSI